MISGAIPAKLRRNHFRSQKIPRNSVSAEFRGHPKDLSATLEEEVLRQADKQLYTVGCIVTLINSLRRREHCDADKQLQKEGALCC